ncbi:hypothetical protein K438DRAFT_1818148 [Mycena galopus ATCC 62051]|nr:hypothetical protein K438DRAFT_1818148 [Mycena galopus ATCC 62051]
MGIGLRAPYGIRARNTDCEDGLVIGASSRRTLGTAGLANKSTAVDEVSRGGWRGGITM